MGSTTIGFPRSERLTWFAGHVGFVPPTGIGSISGVCRGCAAVVAAAAAVVVAGGIGVGVDIPGKCAVFEG